MILPAAPISGTYYIGTRTVYVGIDAEPPNKPSVEFYDTATRRVGTLTRVSAENYRVDGAPRIVLRLEHPQNAVFERRSFIRDAGGAIGFSLWSARGIRPIATVVLIQGADDLTRDMGFLIPYFVAHGLNVVSYDQRGTGISTGDWRYTSPESKAQDVLAMIATVKRDPAVDPHRIGLWAASNGGWVAPIVASDYPVSFMILKSAPGESIASNVLFEVEQDLREHRNFTPAQIAAAMSFERGVLGSLQSNSGWSAVRLSLASVKREPWFPLMRIPPGMPIPPPPPMLAALRASLIYDPNAALRRVRVPTLALFGTLDKNVDERDSQARFRNAFRSAGMSDFTVRVFPGTGHTLVQSKTGYIDEPSEPVRYTGYPEAMIGWLHDRGFASQR